MPSTGKVKARWVAGFEAELPDRTVLVPGETVVEIPAGEAADSANWEPVDAKPEPKPAPKVEVG